MELKLKLNTHQNNEHKYKSDNKTIITILFIIILIKSAFF